MDQFLTEVQPDESNFSFNNDQTNQSYLDITQMDQDNQAISDNDKIVNSPHKIYKSKDLIGKVSLRNNNDKFNDS